MLGEEISDPYETEEGGTMWGMGLLPVRTELKENKTRCLKTGPINKVGGILSCLSGLSCEGYEIHMGKTCFSSQEAADDILISNGKNVYGTYLHGIFDKKEIAGAVLRVLSEKKGTVLKGRLLDNSEYKELQYDKMADILRQHINMNEVYNMLREAKI